MRLQLDGCLVDLDTLEVRRDEVATVLTPLEAALLRYLAGQNGKTVGQRELLREVWGYADSVQTRTVFNTVRRTRTKIEVDPGSPRHLITVRGAGYRLDGVEQSSVGNLGAEVDGFVGRQSELARVDALLGEGARLVVLVGAGGSGKTRLAREAVARMGSAWLCELAGVQSFGEVEERVGALLGLSAGASLDHALAARGPMVLLLDDLTGLSEVSDLGRWLQAAPQLVVVATSRRRLWVAGAHHVEVGPMDPADAVALYTRRAAASGLSSSAGGAAEAAALVDRLDRLPLAIELAAARARMLPAGLLLERIDGRLKVLDLEGPHLPDRHHSLRAVLDDSWALLGDPERRGLARLSIARGAIPLELAEILAGGLDVLSALVDASLVHRDQALLRVVADYGRERLVEMGAREAAIDDLASWLLDPTRRQGLDPFVEDLRWLADELEDSRAAQCALALVPLLVVRAPAARRLAILDRVIGFADTPKLEARCAWRRAEARLAVGDRAGAERDLERVEALGVPSLVGVVDALRGRLLRAQGQSEAALASFARARDAFEAAGRPANVASVDGLTGKVLQSLGRVDEAVDRYHRALDGHIAAQVLDNEANCLCMLVGLTLASEPVSTNRLRVGRATAIARQLHSRTHLAHALANRALLDLVEGDVQAAGTHIEAACQLEAELGRLENLAALGALSALCAAVAGDLAGARRQLDGNTSALRAVVAAVVAGRLPQLEHPTADERCVVHIAQVQGLVTNR